MAVHTRVGATGPTSAGKQLLVTVLDKDNTPLRDLTAKEFLVFEDGAQREVTEAALATSPLSVSVLLDTSKPPLGTAEYTRDIRTALLTFVRTLFAANPKTQVAITEFAGAGVLLRGFTDKPEELEKSITRIVHNQRSNAVLLETLIDASREIRKKPGPRRAIVTIDFASLESSRVPGDRVSDEVFKAGAAVWSVSIHGPTGQDAANREVALDSLTEATGGVRVRAVLPSSLEDLLKRVAECLTSQYLVTYTQPDGATPKTIVPAATKGAKFLRAPWVE
jgi:VWFA-related protein